MAVEWTTPKTDWVHTDKFNVTDFNRIRNNMIWLHQKSIEIFSEFYDIIDVETEYDVSDIATYRQYYKADDFNAFEENLDTINVHTIIQDYGARQTFYENGVFIRFEELNRIESAQLDLYRRLSLMKPSYKTLPLRLGSPYFPFKS